MNRTQDFFKFLKAFIYLDLLVLLYFLIFETKIWFLNTQLAFISSFIIIYSSFVSYKKNIQNRIKNYEDYIENKDIIDQLEDPHDLYSDNEEQKNKYSNKIKNTYESVILSSKAFLSFYRIIGYAVLIFCFFFLNNNNLFMPIAFIIGISIVPFGIVFASYKIKL